MGVVSWWADPFPVFNLGKREPPHGIGVWNPGGGPTDRPNLRARPPYRELMSSMIEQVMTMNAQLGRLEVVPLRDQWANEANHFTPWLAESENLEILASTVGIDLELEETEARVGPFRADILCRDPTNNRYVLVENQIERTDHTHLGQILTYAAGLDAAAVIWIASSFTEEHRQALDWLNEITGEDFHFFGIEAELWRIGDSPPAPRFSLVAKPNQWTKAVRATRPGRSERGETYLEFWTRVTERLRADGDLAVPKPSGMNQLRIPLPDARGVFGYSIKHRRMTFYLLVRGDDPPNWWRRLSEDREQINQEIGLEGLQWRINEDDEWGWVQYEFDCDHEDPKSLATGLRHASNLIHKMSEALAQRL